ncbi:MAG: bifunctional GNAT family N-acetyltransferase/carbon-nitrogen hydrolase family protein [Caulobacterales bacterium]|nr:bifunctional GNAT family N-acetyltransferase/carbon-nitrogen hydrolase family protein [Caulobacterales bacterium]
MTAATAPAKLVARTAQPSDVAAIVDLVDRAYPGEASYSPGMVQGQVTQFPMGQFVVEYEGAVVGYAATFVIDERTAMRPHTWSAITGGGYAARHDPNGDWLYGMEVCVDPRFRGLRIGQRLYDARKRLCEELELKGIVFGGRMPGFAFHRAAYPTPEDYLEAVKAKKIRDPVADFQIGNDFEPQGVLRNYLPSDLDSGGHAALMTWRNPYADPELAREPASGRDPEAVRVATVQYQQRAVASFEEFIANIEYFVDVVTDYKADFVVFPELFTLTLLSFENKRLSPMEGVEAVAGHTERFVEAIRALAISYNVNIIAGSHPTRAGPGDGEIQNVGYVCLRDGQVHAQAKIHPTPNETYWWNFQGGDEARAIQTDCGPIGVLICYDVEFPELARRLADEGARILFVPFCTDTRQGYMRVRYCAQARAIENQCYVVMSGNVGNLPNVENMDIQYARSCILTPCDFPFARDGVAEEASENVEQVTFADLDLSDLAWARTQGTVRNLRDRRFDLYQINWSRRGIDPAPSRPASLGSGVEADEAE